jgi:hypothetical protein
VRTRDWLRRSRDALLLGLLPRDEAPGHQRRTVLIVLGVISIAVVLIVIAFAVRGS